MDAPLPRIAVSNRFGGGFRSGSRGWVGGWVTHYVKTRLVFLRAGPRSARHARACGGAAAALKDTGVGPENKDVTDTLSRHRSPRDRVACVP